MLSGRTLKSGQLCSNMDQTQRYIVRIYERCIDQHIKRQCSTLLCVLWPYVLGKTQTNKKLF